MARLDAAGPSVLGSRRVDARGWRSGVLEGQFTDSGLGVSRHIWSAKCFKRLSILMSPWCRASVVVSETRVRTCGAGFQVDPLPAPGNRSPITMFPQHSHVHSHPSPMH